MKVMMFLYVFLLQMDGKRMAALAAFLGFLLVGIGVGVGIGISYTFDLGLGKKQDCVLIHY